MSNQFFFYFADNILDQVAQEEGVQNDEAEQSQQINMYVQHMNELQKHLKSYAIRTRFATYSRRKRHK